MIVNPTNSTVTIGGRTFPAVVLVCPPNAKGDDGDEYQRLLGGPAVPLVAIAPSLAVYVPCENGLLVSIEQFADEHNYRVALYCPTCSPTLSDGITIWLPETVGLVGRTAVSQPRSASCGVWHWYGCDAEWVAEHIERIAKLPFEIPDGPRVEMRPLSFAYSDEAAL